jgi:3-hydroxybutyryl-CoA dehydrogenase
MKEVSSDMEIKTLGVVGAGQMGSGIAQVASASGLSVIMSDVKDEFVQRGAWVVWSRRRN